MSDMTACLCITCCRGRRNEEAPVQDLHEIIHDISFNFRYACEICGNKRCPHHTDHRLPCTNSNEPGQKGSIYE